EAGYDLGTGDGPIVTPHFSDKDKLYAIVQNLYQQGVQTSAVTYPIVEPGRGRLRLICSAAHTREDINRTLEALIVAEREVDAQLLAGREEPTDSRITEADLVDWAHTFGTYLTEWIEEAPLAIPSLTISVQVAEQGEAISLVVRDGKVGLNTSPEGLPSCTLLLSDRKAFQALQAADAQGLLASISEGTCVLKGQVEPFIWLFARLVEQGSWVSAGTNQEVEELAV
ncbi:MAG TPA: hypothetical protein DCE41_28505, partial [Cytophagales bacterium]|nr:hypothetical protein [Cytophagales bacterium]